MTGIPQDPFEYEDVGTSPGHEAKEASRHRDTEKPVEKPTSPQPPMMPMIEMLNADCTSKRLRTLGFCMISELSIFGAPRAVVDGLTELRNSGMDEDVLVVTFLHALATSQSYGMSSRPCASIVRNLMIEFKVIIQQYERTGKAIDEYQFCSRPKQVKGQIID